jgi:catechol 2,3-dioxygenase-like lactoylglutathione lyase family enzyme
MKSITLHIAEIGLRVENLPVMVAFYQEVLGLEIVLEKPEYVFLKVGELPSPLGAVGHPQMLVLFDRGVALDQAVTTLDHLAFEVPGDLYPTVRERLTAQGMVIRERSWPDSLAWRARSLFIRDPEGNVIELISHDPTAAPASDGQPGF